MIEEQKIMTCDNCHKSWNSIEEYFTIVKRIDGYGVFRFNNIDEQIYHLCSIECLHTFIAKQGEEDGE